MDAYDFSSESSSQEVQEEEKRLISASVLGLIFEKINGYKDGSFFTPGFITMYMCRETLRRAVLQKFKDVKRWQCETIEELKDKIIDRKEANEIINSLKICDPGVGSGHYLVSALNELIAIKSELGILCYRDESRIKYHKVEIQNDELIITDEEDDEIFDYCLSEMNKPISEKQKLQEAIFHEKETIIENCLFGVDINPNSVSICRLRLWIELLKNAYYTQESNYTELETLPNIDINIKQGNSLISRFELHDKLSSLPTPTRQKMKLATEKYKEQVFIYKATDDKAVKEQTRKRIKELKEEFASIVNPNDKDYIRLKELEAELAQQVLIYDRKEVAEWEKKNEKLHKEKEELKKAYNEKLRTLYGNAFEWRFEFPEVLDDEGNFVGFDVVISNPPYGDYYDQSVKKYLIQAYKKSFSGTFDVYIMFVELAMILLHNKGFTSLIIPHTFLDYIQFKALRTFILEQSNVIMLLKLSNVFDDPIVDNAIVLLKRREGTEVPPSYYFLPEIDRINKQILAQNDQLQYDLLSKDRFSLSSSNLSIGISLDIKPLKHYIKVTQGITTGGNKIFILDKEIASKHAFDKTFIKKLIVGKNISKFSLHYDNKVLLYITKNYEVSPNTNKKIYNYLLPYKEILSQKRETIKGTLPWYCIHWPRSEDLIMKPKILIRQTADKIIATLDQDKFYPLDSLHMLTLNYDLKGSEAIDLMKYLLGIMNSKLFEMLYKEKLDEKGKVYPQVKKVIIEELPIVAADNNLSKAIILKVDAILTTKKQNPKADTSAKESEIDKLVYQLYGLTEEEIKIVEGNGTS